MKQDERAQGKLELRGVMLIVWQQQASGRLVKKKACAGDERGVDGDFALGITALSFVREARQKHARAKPPHQQRDGGRTPPRGAQSAQFMHKSCTIHKNPTGGIALALTATAAIHLPYRLSQAVPGNLGSCFVPKTACADLYRKLVPDITIVAALGLADYTSAQVPNASISPFLFSSAYLLSSLALLLPWPEFLHFNSSSNHPKMKLHQPSFRRLLSRPSAICNAALPRANRSATVRGTGLTFARFFSNHAQRQYASVSAADLQFGQAVYETHPHVLKPGELTPGITAQEYADRRAALVDLLPQGAVVVLHAASLQYKSGAVFYPYRQESNFFWLTGWEEPEAVAVIEKTGPTTGDYTFRLFVQPKNSRDEQWSGYRNGVQAAEDIFNADEAYSIDGMGSLLPDILNGATSIYADAQPTEKPSKNSILEMFSGKTSWPSRTPLYPLMNRLRVIKSPAEVANMRRAGQISGRAITDAMRRPWTREKDLHAFLDYQFTINGCEGSAYIPVIAGGERANCIHYTVNNNVFRDGELILVDAGGQYGTYITDISRTWPVTGRFTAAQRDLYEAVLTVQRDSVALCRQNARMSLEDIHGSTVRGLMTSLRSIGFDVSNSNIDQLFPHHVGHYIGLDVHDCPGYPRREILRRGHCVTIEPGVYVPDDERWPAHFRGMGVRIEDSICVDETEPYILTTEAVKEVADIEALRA